MKELKEDINRAIEFSSLPLAVEMPVHGSMVVIPFGSLSEKQILEIIHLAGSKPCSVYADSMEEGALQYIKNHPNINLYQREAELKDLIPNSAILIAEPFVKDTGIAKKALPESSVYIGKIKVREGPGYTLFLNPEASSWKLRKWKSKWYPDFDGEIKWKKIAAFSVIAFALMIVGHLIFSFIPLTDITIRTIDWFNSLDRNFFYMVLAGFLAQLIDGALGMGYGVTSTTILLSSGVNLASISGSVHSAEMFASGVSGYSHYKFGNVNKKLFRALVIPGVIGAVAGAYLLCLFGESHSEFVRPLLATYTLFLGVKIILNAFKDKLRKKKFKRYKMLAGAGGFLDSFGGGGWGPIVTSTLISKGRNPKYVIGSVSLTEFFVTLSSALTFFIFLGISHWQVILGLVTGSIIAAPFAALLVGKLPRKTTYILLGILIIFWSGKILLSIF